MDLIFKFYQNKYSRIGVKYLYEHTAKKDYEHLLLQGPSETYRMQLELSGEKINLFLVSDQSGKKITYLNLNYKPEEIRNFQKIKHNDAVFQFVHVFSKANKLFIAKPFHKEEFIVISNLQVLNLLNQ